MSSLAEPYSDAMHGHDPWICSEDVQDIGMRPGMLKSLILWGAFKYQILCVSTVVLLLYVEATCGN